MQFDREKLKEAVLYIAKKCPPESLGAVKMHKVFYFVDMLHFAESGVPFFGALYRKRPKGPTCEQLISVLDELQRAGDLQISQVEYFGYQKKQYNALRAPDCTRFNAQEFDLLDEVIEFVCRNNTAKTISDFSHRLPWELVEFGDEIDYTSAFLLFPDEPSQDAKAWAEQEAKTVEAERSKSNPMDFNRGSDFRGRVLAACGG